MSVSDSNQSIEEPRTSSFQDPSNESALASLENETLEQCLRRSRHAQQAFNEARSETSDHTNVSVLEEENADKAEEVEDDDDGIPDKQEDRNKIEDETRSSTSSQR